MVTENNVHSIVMLNSLHEYDRLSEYDGGHPYNRMTVRHQQQNLPVCHESIELDEIDDIDDIEISRSTQRASTIRQSMHDGKYWPDGQDEVMELTDGISVKLIKSEQHQSIYKRFCHD